MSLKNMALSNGAGATVTVAGGSSLDFADDGVSIPNGLHLVVTNDDDYLTRRTATVKFKPPTLDAKTASYSKDKKSISFAVPFQLANGRIVFNTIRVEREVHPSFTADECLRLNVIGAQLLTASATDAFWATGSLS